MTTTLATGMGLENALPNSLVRRVYIPASLRYIGSFAFEQAAGTVVTFAGPPPKIIGRDVFRPSTRPGVPPPEVVFAYDQPGWDFDVFGREVFPSHHTVTFMDGDEVMKVESVPRRGRAVPPEVPVREGYLFGWDTTFDNVTSDLTVRTIWEIETFFVTFMVDFAVFERREIERGTRTRTPVLPPPVVTGETRVWINDDRAIRLRPATSFAVFDDITLYAVREPCAHTTACESCAGRGGTMPTTMSCRPCNGTGRRSVGWCSACNGRGHPCGGHFCNCGCNGRGFIESISRTGRCDLCERNGFHGFRIDPDLGFTIIYLRCAPGGTTIIRVDCVCARCVNCRGSGLVTDGTAICTACNGNPRTQVPSVPCATCSATGLGIGPPVLVLHGDVNGDGQINIIDLTLLRLYIAGQITAEDIYAENADLNISGAVDSYDAALLRRILAGFG